LVILGIPSKFSVNGWYDGVTEILKFVYGPDDARSIVHTSVSRSLINASALLSFLSNEGA